MQEETLLKFPCDFPIKVVGKNNEAFEMFVLSVLHKHFPDLGESALRQKTSKDNTYLSITATVHAESKEQLDAVYRELTGSELTLMVL